MSFKRQPVRKGAEIDESKGSINLSKLSGKLIVLGKGSQLKDLQDSLKRMPKSISSGNDDLTEGFYETF